MAEWPAIPWGTVSPWALVAAAVFGVISGRLIPWVTWKAWQTAWDTQIKNAHEENLKLHAAIKKNAEAMDLYNSQLKDLLDTTRATEQRFAFWIQTEGINTRNVVEAKSPQSDSQP